MANLAQFRSSKLRQYMRGASARQRKSEKLIYAEFYFGNFQFGTGRAAKMRRQMPGNFSGA
jgi:hypothetical protein